MNQYKRNSPPGYAVRFLDGTWLADAHGWFQSDDAFYADIFLSIDQAKIYLEISGFKDAYEIIPAWEPLCEKLRREVSSLTKINKITSKDIEDIQNQLETALRILKEKYNG